MGNSEVNDMYSETGITESTRKMFEFIDDMFTPNHMKQKRASHLYHLVGELEALRDDLREALLWCCAHSVKGCKSVF